MNDDADRLAGALRAVLRERLESSASVRALAVEIAEFVLREAALIDSAAGSEAATADGRDAADQGTGADESAARPGAAAAPARASDAARGRVALRLGDAQVQLDVDGSAHELAAAMRTDGRADGAPHRQDGSARGPGTGQGHGDAGGSVETDLRLVAERCRLKAQSCRLFVGRRRASGDAERDAIAQMHALLDRAKALPDCFLWVFMPHREQPTDSALRTIADSYDTLADAADLCGRATDPDDPAGAFDADELALAMQWLAEANSALRVVIQWTWLSDDDHDQDAAHQWLRRETAERQVFVQRHMKLSDPADPGRAAALREEIGGMLDTVERRRATIKEVAALLKRVRYHAQRLADASGNAEHDCRRINDALESIGALGIPHSDLRLREIRAMIDLTAFPESVPPHPALRHEDTLPVPRSAEDGADEPRWSEAVLRVRSMLRGGAIIVIGGNPRRDAIDRIEDAFAPSRVEWVDLEEHGPGEPMRAPIARVETTLVVILVKLCGHLHVGEARSWARECGKAVVMLPAGYNPEQIAAQVLDQASGRLPSTRERQRESPRESTGDAVPEPARDPDPGARNADPGARNADPGARNADPGARNADPGARNADPDGPNLRIARSA